MHKTIVSDPLTYNVNNIIFEKPKEQSAKLENGSSLNFFRVNLKTKNPDGKTQGDLILRFDRSLCLKLSDSFGSETLSALMLLWDNQVGPTPRQSKTKEVIEQIVEKCKEWLTVPENKKSIKKTSYKAGELEKLNPLRMKEDEDGNVNPNDAPMMALRLVQFKDRTDKHGNFVPAKIATQFYHETERDANGQQIEVNPKDFINKRFHATFAVKVEDIFIGKEISLQFKLLEAVVKPFDEGPKRLLSDVLASVEEDENFDVSDHTEITDDVIPVSELSLEGEEDGLKASDNEEEEVKQVVTSKAKRGGKK